MSVNNINARNPLTAFSHKITLLLTVFLIASPVTASENSSDWYQTLEQSSGTILEAPSQSLNAWFLAEILNEKSAPRALNTVKNFLEKSANEAKTQGVDVCDKASQHKSFNSVLALTLGAGLAHQSNHTSQAAIKELTRFVSHHPNTLLRQMSWSQLLRRQSNPDVLLSAGRNWLEHCEQVSDNGTAPFFVLKQSLYLKLLAKNIEDFKRYYRAANNTDDPSERRKNKYIAINAACEPWYSPEQIAFIIREANTESPLTHLYDGADQYGLPEDDETFRTAFNDSIDLYFGLKLLLHSKNYPRAKILLQSRTPIEQSLLLTELAGESPRLAKAEIQEFCNGHPNSFMAEKIRFYLAFELIEQYCPITP